MSVVCDTKLLPRKIYLLRLPLGGGQFTEASYLTLLGFTRPECVTQEDLATHSTEGWPGDFFRKLAVALDVPIAALDVPFGIGGP